MNFKFTKLFIIELIVFSLFIIFLISIPFLNKNNDNFNDDIVKNFGENSNEVLKYKFQIMSKDIGSFFENNLVSEINNKYLSELIVSNKISNRDNTLAQELISLNKRNYTNESRILSNSLIKDFLLYYDGVEVGTWRNYLFEFENKNKSFIIYNNSDLLVNLSDASIIGNYSFLVQPFEYQIYNITLENGSNQIIKINLENNSGEEELSKYIDLNNNKPLVKIKEIKSNYIKSNQKYLFNFFIWK